MGFLNQEIADCLRNGVFDISEDDFEVGVDPFSHFLNKDIASGLLLWRLLSLHLLRLPSWIIWVLLRVAAWRTCGLGYDISSIGLVRSVVGKQIVYFGVNDSLNNLSGLISFRREDLYNDVHDFWDHAWESLENLLNNASSNLLELCITILNEFQSWIPKFFKLRRYQVNKNINRWETWQSVTFMHLNGLLNMHIVIFTASLVAIELLIQIVKRHFDLSSTGQVAF